MNTAQTITIPTLGVGFAQTVSLPGLRNTSGQPFRAGIDGLLPLPQSAAATSPIVPSKPFGETLSFVVDPFISVPRNHVLSLTIQRELPGKMLTEFGYAGRLGRNLYQSINLNQVPYMHKDLQSGQTFAQAFDALADQLRAGTAPTAVVSQPWFENILVRLNPIAGSRTRALASVQAANIINGNLSNLFLGFLDFVASQPFDNLQALELFYRTSLGRSNYHAFILTLRKGLSKGLTFDVNYTLSRSRDQIGVAQGNTGLLPNSFFPDSEYAASNFDITHILNSNWIYELPFGNGKRLSGSSHSLLRGLTSGWYTSGVFRAASGAPLTVVQGSQVWGGSQLLGFSSGAIPGSGSFDTGVFSGVNGDAGVGVAGSSAQGGTGLNLFAAPATAYNSFRRIRLSEDTRSGRNVLRGFGFWQLDLTVGKATAITDRMKLRFSIDLINILNHVNFNDPVMDLQSPATFGVITSQRINDVQGIFPRRVQIGARLEF